MKKLKNKILDFIADHFPDWWIGLLMGLLFALLLNLAFSPLPFRAEEKSASIDTRMHFEFSRLEYSAWVPYFTHTYDHSDFDDIYFFDTDFAYHDHVNDYNTRIRIYVDPEYESFEKSMSYNLEFYFNYAVDLYDLFPTYCQFNLYYEDNVGHLTPIYSNIGLTKYDYFDFSLTFSPLEDCDVVVFEILFNAQFAFPGLSDNRYQSSVDCSFPTLTSKIAFPNVPDLPVYDDLDNSLNGSVNDVLDELLDKAPTGTDSISLFVRTILSHHVILDTLTIVVCFGVVSFILYGKE